MIASFFRVFRVCRGYFFGFIPGAVPISGQCDMAGLGTRQGGRRSWVAGFSPAGYRHLARAEARGMKDFVSPPLGNNNAKKVCPQGVLRPL